MHDAQIQMYRPLLWASKRSYALPNMTAGVTLESRASSELTHIAARSHIPNQWQLLLVHGHEQLDGALPDVQGGHVRQEVIPHEEAHKYCSQITSFERLIKRSPAGCQLLLA